MMGSKVQRESNQWYKLNFRYWMIRICAIKCGMGHD